MAEATKKVAKKKETKAEKETPKKSYTVKYRETGKKRARQASFDKLVDARIFGMETYREDNFVSLTNAKGVVLPLGKVATRQIQSV